MVKAIDMQVFADVCLMFVQYVWLASGRHDAFCHLMLSQDLYLSLLLDLHGFVISLAWLFLVVHGQLSVALLVFELFPRVFFVKLLSSTAKTTELLTTSWNPIHEASLL